MRFAPCFQLRGDLYCSGDYILHLDSDSVIFETVTYDHIFHLGKPVLPYRRYREELSSGETIMCRQLFSLHEQKNVANFSSASKSYI